VLQQNISIDGKRSGLLHAYFSKILLLLILYSFLILLV
jgi:hypothetical protein